MTRPSIRARVLEVLVRAYLEDDGRISTTEVAYRAGLEFAQAQQALYNIDGVESRQGYHEIDSVPEGYSGSRVRFGVEYRVGDVWTPVASYWDRRSTAVAAIRIRYNEAYGRALETGYTEVRVLPLCPDCLPEQYNRAGPLVLGIQPASMVERPPVYVCSICNWSSE